MPPDRRRARWESHLTDTLCTTRLLLRRWTTADREPFAALNADPVVMEHFPQVLTRAESDALADRAEAHLAGHGWGLWAVEVLGGGSAVGGFAGFTGLAIPRFHAQFTPAMEVGWRFGRWAWGHGYATEAAEVALSFAFGVLGRTDVVSFTSSTNLRSQSVMRRLGMTRDVGGDFAHPALPEGHRLSQHVLYRLSADDWRAHRAGPLGPLGRSGDAPVVGATETPPDPRRPGAAGTIR